MMRSIVMHRTQWLSRSLVLLAALFLVVGCSRALEEQLEGKERELAEIRTTLAEIEGKLAASSALARAASEAANFPSMSARVVRMSANSRSFPSSFSSRARPQPTTATNATMHTSERLTQ